MRPSRQIASAAVTILVASALVSVMAAATPDDSVAPRSWTRLVVGETGALRDLTLTVTEVRVAPAVDVRGEPLPSTEAFVVVAAEVAASDEPVGLNQVWLTTRDDRRYEPRDEWPSRRPPIFAQPGFTVAGSWVFEVPRERLTGAELVVENDSAEFTWYDRALRIDLGLSDQTVGPGPLTLPEGSVRVSR